MSFNVTICTEPIPKNDQQAWDAVDDIVDTEGEPPEVFRKLHDLLTARYPCITTLSDDEVDNGAWSDGPLWNNFGHRAAVLGISSSRVDEVLPFLVKAANDMGLTVFDPAEPKIYRPKSGWRSFFKS